jgi:nucleoside-diphosphate-sugar epimerase
MQVVITGAAGFLGRKLAQRLLDGAQLVDRDGRAAPVDRLLLFDVVAVDGFDDPRVVQVAGDIADAALVRRTIDAATDSVFHLAAVLSAGAEADFDLGYRVNLDGTRAVLEACRALDHAPRLLFTSSVAVFGGELPARLDDDTPLRPQTSYGVQKATGELLLNDYTRKGFLDGRALRLPTIVVRPGAPNLAASTFASSIIREPLSGQEAVCPVAAESRMWNLSPRRVVEAFLHAHDLPSEAWGWNRSLNLPGLPVTVGGMVEALRRVAGDAPVGRIRWRPDPFIQRIVSGWPGDFATPRALDMGFRADAAMDDIIRAFIDDDLPAQRAAPKP